LVRIPSKFSLLAGLAACVAAAGAAQAAPAPILNPGQAASIRELAACEKLTEDAVRLACYDKSVRALVQAEGKGEVVVVDRAQVSEVRRQSFGFQIPSLNIFSRSGGDKAATPAAAARVKEDEEDSNRTVVTVASTGRTPDGKLTLATSEGGLWVQTDTLPVDRPPAAGSKVTIVRGRVGGYFCDVTRYQSVRCERRK
jgi:hypothetical protein